MMFPLRGLSLERKLPLFLGALLLAVITALTVASWRTLSETVEGSAADRLNAVAKQLRDNFQQSLMELRAGVRTAAADSAVSAFARGDRARRNAALASLRNVPNQADQVLATELRDASGRVLLTTNPAETTLAATPLHDVIPATEPGDGPVVGAFHLIRGTLAYPIASPVEGAPDVYLVRWRRIVGSRRTRELITQLVGSGASIYIGNARGEGWSDLERPVPRPAFLPDSPGDSTAMGPRLLASAIPIAGSPWMVAVAFPRAIVRAPVNAFLGRIALLAAVALALALILAWLLSRRITAPLADLTRAAEGMAAGEYAQEVQIRSDDELGRLATSFSHMSAEVRRSRHTLEDQVRERTRELDAALRELRDAQDALVRRERLALLGQLSSGVGHELRNPLGVMTNSVYYLKAVLGDAPPKVREYLDIMQQQISLSEKIVSDLLDFARQKPPVRTPVSLRELTDAQLERLGRRDGVRILVDLPDDAPDALADPVQAGQIVFNLLTNAVQALDGAGRIEVRVRRSGDMVEYLVSDSGPGVSADSVEKIFEPLFTTKARGIGLGLAVSRALARANGGDLVLQSAGGGGTGATFALTLQVASPVRAPTPAAAMTETA